MILRLVHNISFPIRYCVVTVLLAVVLLVGGLVMWKKLLRRRVLVPEQGAALIINDKPLAPVSVATTPVARYRGLSGLRNFPDSRALVFVFEHDDFYSMVMRDMFFPIDIVWANDGVIVHLASNVLPEPGKKEAELTRYTPITAADTVVEFPAGSIHRYDLRLGGRLLLKITR